ncbi:hypothetical protein AALP_AA7G011400 [Arabis alpina]|uniref:DUF7806 domain-containing protein n=1 Tax=Arabis alpina TaxID=50452 RepID=A0A087GFA2_ARAAL|nr:hypothetical protein AALP_AA7G011400 [Arabis alpina]
MEALYAKLYDKYTNLKKKKFSEFDEVNKEQEDKFLNFVTASEELMQHLTSENENLKERVKDLRTEITSVRLTKDKESLECQKLIIEQERKNKVLCEEVYKLKELIQEGDHSGSKQERKTPETAQMTTRKRRRQTEDVVERDIVSPETLLVTQPQCCNGSSSSATSCTFQALGEHLLGMKLSTYKEGEQVCIIASHPTSGFSFSLSLVNNSTGEESELLYKVVSLGTFERVAPKWMRDDIRFSTSMCPVFFERVARVIKLQC